MQVFVFFVSLKCDASGNESCDQNLWMGHFIPSIFNKYSNQSDWDHCIGINNAQIDDCQFPSLSLNNEIAEKWCHAKSWFFHGISISIQKRFNLTDWSFSVWNFAKFSSTPNFDPKWQNRNIFNSFLGNYHKKCHKTYASTPKKKNKCC